MEGWQNTPRGAVLCGFMGCGKTTLGRLLAQRMGWRFADLDDIIVQREGLSVPDLFAQRGEAGFREAEHQAARDLALRLNTSPLTVTNAGGLSGQTGDRPVHQGIKAVADRIQGEQSIGLVLATGGGALTFSRNVEVLRQIGPILFLNPGFDICYSRIKDSDRPLVRQNTREQLEQLYNNRREQYRDALVHGGRELPATGGKNQCVEEMVRALQPSGPVCALRIRDYTSADMPAITDLWLASTTAGHPFISPEHWTANIPRLEREYLPAAETRLCESNGKLLGFLSVLTGSFIGALFVAPEAFGRGVGTVLMEDAKSRYNHLELAVYRDNGQAVAFYKKQGFIVLEEVLDDETHQPQLMMLWSGDPSH